MLTARWLSKNPAYAHALVDVLTQNETSAIVRTYDQTTHLVPLNELEAFVELEVETHE